MLYSLNGKLYSVPSIIYNYEALNFLLMTMYTEVYKQVHDTHTRMDNGWKSYQIVFEKNCLFTFIMSDKLS